MLKSKFLWLAIRNAIIELLVTTAHLVAKYLSTAKHKAPIVPDIDFLNGNGIPLNLERRSEHNNICLSMQQTIDGVELDETRCELETTVVICIDEQTELRYCISINAYVAKLVCIWRTHSLVNIRWDAISLAFSYLNRYGIIFELVAEQTSMTHSKRIPRNLKEFISLCCARVSMASVSDIISTMARQTKCSPIDSANSHKSSTQSPTRYATDKGSIEIDTE